MSLRISLTNDQVPYHIEICYGANIFSLNLILFRYFVFGSNEKLEIYVTIEAGVIYPIPFILFTLSQESIIEILLNPMLKKIHMIDSYKMGKCLAYMVCIVLFQ